MNAAELQRHRADQREVVADAGASRRAMTRMYLARSGMSMPMSFSTASVKPTLFRMRRDVVEPVGVGQALHPGDVLAGLLEAAVQKADLGVGLDDGLAVELDVGAHRAVHGGVRRARG